MRNVPTGPVIGLITQIGLIAAVSVVAGLGVAGWLAGIAWGLATWTALTRGLARAGRDRLGPADRVTLVRATLVGGVTALVVDSFTRPVRVPLLVGVAAVALLLDAVDGKVARWTGTVSGLGARFDMEVDAFLILVLSVYVARPVGPWVLAIGAMRYAFVLAIWVLPWMRGTLPPRYWRKVVAATQGIVLALAAAAVLPRPLLAALVAASLGLLVESFGRDVAHLWRSRPAAARAEPVFASASGGAPAALVPAGTEGYRPVLVAAVVGAHAMPVVAAEHPQRPTVEARTAAGVGNTRQRRRLSAPVHRRAPRRALHRAQAHNAG